MEAPSGIVSESTIERGLQEVILGDFPSTVAGMLISD